MKGIKEVKGGLGGGEGAGGGGGIHNLKPGITRELGVKRRTTRYYKAAMMTIDSHRADVNGTLTTTERDEPLASGWSKVKRQLDMPYHMPQRLVSEAGNQGVLVGERRARGRGGGRGGRGGRGSTSRWRLRELDVKRRTRYYNQS